MMDLGFVGPSRPAQDYRFLKAADGDTPTIEMSIGMVSLDTPESEYVGNPPTAQAALERAKPRLQDGTYDALPQGLRDYLRPGRRPAAPDRRQAGRRSPQEHGHHPAGAAGRLAAQDGGHRHGRGGGEERPAARLHRPLFLPHAVRPAAASGPPRSQDVQPRHGRARLGGHLHHLPVHPAPCRPELAAGRGRAGLAAAARRVGPVRAGSAAGLRVPGLHQTRHPVTSTTPPRRSRAPSSGGAWTCAP